MFNETSLDVTFKIHSNMTKIAVIDKCPMSAMCQTRNIAFSTTVRHTICPAMKNTRLAFP